MPEDARANWQRLADALNALEEREDFTVKVGETPQGEPLIFAQRDGLCVAVVDGNWEVLREVP